MRTCGQGKHHVGVLRPPEEPYLEKVLELRDGCTTLQTTKHMDLSITRRI